MTDSKTVNFVEKDDEYYQDSTHTEDQDVKMPHKAGMAKGVGFTNYDNKHLIRRYKQLMKDRNQLPIINGLFTINLFLSPFYLYQSPLYSY